MLAFIDGQPLVPTLITLDDVNWDHARVTGERQLRLILDRQDLLAIGREIGAFAHECVREDPDYFKQKHMNDVPVPATEDIFVKKPQSLASFFTESFWKKLVIDAVINRMQAIHPGVGRPGPEYLIQNFIGLKDDKRGVELLLGVTSLSGRTLK